MILSNEAEVDYHAKVDIASRSFLWTMYDRTPHHARSSPPKKSKAMDLGSATHIAVLQPELLEASVFKGPENRMGNKWKDVVQYCQAYGKIPLTSVDYEKVMYMRDSAQRLKAIRALTSGGAQIEHSAYWIDPATGIECRCRPDIYQPELKIIGDVKSTNNAGENAWGRSVAEYGYHLQDAMYVEGWQEAGGGEVDAFVFILIENEYPFACALEELPPSASMEGQAIFRKTMAQLKQCRETNTWPGYPDGVRSTDLPKWAYRETFQNA